MAQTAQEIIALNGSQPKPRVEAPVIAEVSSPVVAEPSFKTVKDLIEQLQELPQDLIVGMASDEEGNEIHEWSGDISFAVYDEAAYSPDNFVRSIFDNDEEGYQLEETERQVDEAAATAIIIWP